MTTVGSADSPWPISQYVLKVHSRCDLACDHCYVYEHVDQGWRSQPMVMTIETVRTVADRIAEHAAAHRLSGVTVVLHGGEPLLIGPEHLRDIARTLRERIEAVTRLHVKMQSNGVLLSGEFCDALVEYDIRIGISLDGDRAANDRHRRFASGASSHEKVLRALAMLRRPQWQQQFSGILCTVDIANDPIAVFDALRAERPPRIDLLLPHATWDHPPVRPDGEATPYATWLLAVYDRWVATGRPMPIRLFDSLRSTAHGGTSGNEWVGLDPADLVVVETDGSWEKVDSLKTTYAGAPATGYTVFTHAVDAVSVLPDVARRQTGLDELAGQCRACPVVRQCGGGLFAHRYRAGSGFDNPSAYCADLKELIVSLNERMGIAPVAATHDHDDTDLPVDLVDRVGSGRPDGDTVRFLADSQLSVTRALLVAIAGRGSTATEPGWELLGRLDQESPDAVNATLVHPYVRTWAIDALRRFDVDESGGGYLSCVAAAAAIHSGAVAELDVPIRSGILTLPSVGAVTLPIPVTGQARLTVSPDGCMLRHGSDVMRFSAGAVEYAGSEGSWQPSRWFTIDGASILLEDLDPHRDCHDWKAAERLSDASSALWLTSLAAAWRHIEADAPAQLGALRMGLRAVVPLVDDPQGTLRSSTARQAFGSVAIARANDRAMAVMIVHEFQHNILGALLDLCTLVDPTHRGRISVAWRTDLRPVEGVLQGTYAHMAIADMWRARAERAGSTATEQEQYVQYRAWTESAVDALIRSAALTPAGERFVGRIAETLASWSR